MATHTPLARRLPGLDARHATPRARLFRRAVALLALVGVVLLLAAVLTVTFVGLSNSPGPSASAGHGDRSAKATGHGTRSTTATSSGTTRGAATRGGRAGPDTRSPAPATTPPLVSLAATWLLPAPVEAETVLPGAPGELVVMGGSTTGGSVADGIFSLDTASGTLVQLGDLRSGLDDAAGATVDGQPLVFGGASPAPIATVQGPASTGPSSGASGAPSTVVGALPGPRSGDAAVTVGTVTYVVGGSDGSAPAPTVLGTADGRTFTVVATLPDPVADAAVVAVDGQLYVFGGRSLTGADAGRPVADIQVVDPATHTARRVGSMPEPLSGAAAVDLDGRVLVLGGDTAGATGTSGTGTSGTGTSGTGTSGISTSATVWAFDPATGRLVAAGRLAVPVADAGVAVSGQTVWLVGGETDGAPLSTAQSLTAG